MRYNPQSEGKLGPLKIGNILRADVLLSLQVQNQVSKRMLSDICYRKAHTFKSESTCFQIFHLEALLKAVLKNDFVLEWGGGRLPSKCPNFFMVPPPAETTNLMVLENAFSRRKRLWAFIRI